MSNKGFILSDFQTEQLLKNSDKFKLDCVQKYRLRYDGKCYFGNPTGIEKPRALRKNKKADERYNSFCKLYSRFLPLGHQFDFLKKNILPKIEFEFPHLTTFEGNGMDNESYVVKMLSNKISANNDKAKYFRNKVKMNCHRFNYFGTVTYDSKIFSSELEFEIFIKNKFSHLSTRHGWKIMGAFERGHNPVKKKTVTANCDVDNDETLDPKDGRLHFHGFFSIPLTHMCGALVEKKHYSKKKHKWVTFVHHSAFENVGMTDFQTISKKSIIDVQRGDKNFIENYIAKYITKSECTLYYSGSLPNEMLVPVDTNSELWYIIQFKRFGNMQCYIVEEADLLSRDPIYFTTMTKELRLKSLGMTTQAV